MPGFARPPGIQTAYGIVGGTLGQAYTIENDGTIVASAGDAIRLEYGATITNGGTSDTAASIGGQSGIVVTGAEGVITNYATIEGSEGAIYLGAGGIVENHGAIISTGSRVAALEVTSGNGRVVNAGTIEGHYGIEFACGSYGSVPSCRRRS
jgi:hypothetical protein